MPFQPSSVPRSWDARAHLRCFGNLTIAAEPFGGFGRSREGADYLPEEEPVIIQGFVSVQRLSYIEDDLHQY